MTRRAQGPFSPAFGSSEPELRLCHKFGIAFLPWRPLEGIKNAVDVGTTYVSFAKVAHELDVTPAA